MLGSGAKGCGSGRSVGLAGGSRRSGAIAESRVLLWSRPVGACGALAASTSASWQHSERKRASGCDGGRGAVEGEGEGPSRLASGQPEGSNRTVVKSDSGQNWTVVKSVRGQKGPSCLARLPLRCGAEGEPCHPASPTPSQSARARPRIPRPPPPMSVACPAPSLSAAGPGPPQPCRPGSVRACSVQADAPHASGRLPPLLPPPPP